jgi:hypothetical protein
MTVRKLQDIYKKCIDEREGESYCMLGLPKPMTDELSLVEKGSVQAVEKMVHTRERSEVGKTWMVDSGPSCKGQERPDQTHAVADSMSVDQQTRQAVSPSAKIIRHDRTANEADKRTPLPAPCTEGTLSGVASQRGEGGRGTETTAEHLPPSSHNQMRSSSQTPSLVDDQARQHRAMIDWLDHWFCCCKPRAKAHSQIKS